MSDYFFRTIIDVDLEKVRTEVQRAVDLFGWSTGDHICLIHPWEDPGYHNPFGDSASKRTWQAGRKMSDFKWPNRTFGDSYLFEIWNTLRYSTGIPVARMRIARIRPNRCYSFHNDEERRLHLAVDTNSKAFFVVSEYPRDSNNMPVYPEPRFVMENLHSYHVSADGFFYNLDANHAHTAFNGGQTERIHLVIETINELNDRPVS